ncbi:glycosyltransferase [Senegalia massiliensis]|uniref:glycosyltransferase n=1 Tax=Senegalia massiliensis TaxID=1720316 RepID=UPI001031914D|nr:glycosyltransferase [Senegalia massiliensis]
MKRIFMLMKYYLDPNTDSHFPKFDYQIETLEKMDYEVYYLGIEKNNIYLCNGTNKEFICSYYNTKIQSLKTIFIYNSLYKATIKVIEKGLNFDIAYIRYMPVSWNFKKALVKLKNIMCKMVVEIPTYPIEKEINLESRFIRKIYFKISHKYFVNQSHHIDLFALIGEKSSYFAGRPAINIENGISLKDIPLRNPNFKKDDIHILCLANMAKWHGYDRLIEGLRLYKNNSNKISVTIHLVGSDADGSMRQWRELVKNYQLENNVIFEGPKHGSDLDWYFDRCQVAVGSLGLHRIGYSSAATLKVREYMSRGIPFILSGYDQSITDQEDFYIKVPEDDSPIKIDTIISKIIDINNWNILGNNMRKYAEDNMSWKNQFIKIIRNIGE